MTQTNVNSIAVNMQTPEFATGYVAGQMGFFPNGTNRFDISLPCTEPGILAIVRNLVELGQEGILTDELLRHDCGLIVGWVTRPR